MMSIVMTRWFARGLMMAWLCAALPADSQSSQAGSPPPSESPSVRISLGSTSANPGEATVVPLYFTPASDIHVARLTLHVTFVSANLKFDKLETGIAAEFGNVSLTHDLRLSKNADDVETSTLTVEALAGESSATGIPSGLLAYIQLRVNETARPAEISLRTVAEATEKETGRDLKIQPPPVAIVEVIAPGSEPAVVCFFFTH